MIDKKYHLTKSDDGWQLKLEGGKRASLTGDTKQEVLAKSIKLAKSQTSASIMIHKSNGNFQEERTYPKSSDPKSSEG